MAVDLRIEGYEEPAEVGWGGFAVVYRARQSRVDREVAIKVLNVRPGADVAGAFRRECAAIGSLSGHPNIVSVHGTGETPDGRPFIVMELLHGGSLGDQVRARGPLPWTEAAEIGVQLAGALATAHRAGILHRDVKPENVLVSRFGQPKLGDFGIARLQDGTPGSGGGLVGSLRHAAPEILAGQPPAAPSDVYSLGSTLFTVLAGHPPFGSGDDGDTAALLRRIVTAAVPDLRRQGVPDAVCRVVEQALAKDPAERQGSAEELGRQLQEALAATGAAVPALAVGPGTAPGRRAARLKAAALLAAGVAALAGAALLAARGAGEVAAPPTTVTTVAPTTTAPPTTSTTTPPPQPGRYTDDFSAAGRDWPVSRNPDAVAVSDIADDRYRFTATPPAGADAVILPPLYAPITVSPSHAVRIEVDATKTSAGRGYFGVACGGPSSQFPYGALVDVDGSWRLVRTEASGSPTDILSGRAPAAIAGPGPHRVVLECAGEGEPISVTLTVDGAVLASTTAPRGRGHGRGPAMLVLPLSSAYEVSFDNLDIAYS